MYCMCAMRRLQFSGLPTVEEWMCFTMNRNRFLSHSKIKFHRLRLKKYFAR